MGAAGNLFMYQTWQQAAAEGITVVVAAGDTGSADCDNYIPLDGTNGMGVSAFASTPYDVAVGGTDFYASYANPATYWNATNNPTTQASALSYIPEIPWNASCASPEVFTTFGGGAGVSSPLPVSYTHLLPTHVVARSQVISKEEQLVVQNGSAHGAAELRERIRAGGKVLIAMRVAVGVKPVILCIAECRAVKLVGSALQHNHHARAIHVTVVCW